MPALPLFPLGTVLVPGERLDLRIFEPRYVILLRDLLTRRERGELDEFGVIAIRVGHEVGADGVVALYDVGCSARLVRVREASSRTFEVVAEGVRRFRLEGLDAQAHTPYLTGHVTWLHDRSSDAELAALLAARLTRAVTEYRSDLGLPEVELPTDAVALSYAAAHQVLLDLGDRQQILAQRDLVDRLRLSLRLTRREHTLVRELGAVPGAFVSPQPVQN